MVKRNQPEPRIDEIKTAVLVMFALLSLVITSCTSKKEPEQKLTSSNSNNGVINGIPLPAEHDFSKSTAAVLQLAQTKDKKIVILQVCTGTLVNKRLIVTAGHCTTEDPTRLFVLFSNELPEDGVISEKIIRSGNLRQVVGGIAHPLWAQSAGKTKETGDIAVLLLNSDAPAGSQPATILRAPRSLDRNQNAPVLIAGYGYQTVEQHKFTEAEAPQFEVDHPGAVIGKTKDGNYVGFVKIPSNELRAGRMILSNSKFSNSEIELTSANKESGQSACQGDSGGPAYMMGSGGKVLLVGVTSRGVTLLDGVTCTGGVIYTSLPANFDFVSGAAKTLLAPNYKVKSIPQPPEEDQDSPADDGEPTGRAEPQRAII